MTAFEYYKKCFTQYAVFTGRAQRAEYWYFVLFNILFSWAAIIIDAFVFGINESGLGLCSSLYTLVAFIPGLAVAARRLHDIGRSGWNMLWALIPMAGIFVLIIFYCMDSEQGSNKWGKNPKETEA